MKLLPSVFKQLVRGLVVALVACHPETSTVASVPVPTDHVPQIIALRGATLIDGTGGEPIPNAVLLLRGDVIDAVGSATNVSVPAGARIIQCDGKTIMPGLVSDHVHVGLVDGVSVGGPAYNRENILRQLQQYEAYGVTTVTSLGLNGPLFGALRAEMHAGQTRGADLFGVDRGIGTEAGAPPEALLHLSADQIFRPSTPDEARADVRAMISQRTDFVKIWLDDYGGTLPAMKPEVLEAAIAEAHTHGVRVAAHIHDLAAAKAVVRAGVDILAHGVRDALVDDDLVQLLRDHKVWYVSTLSVDDSGFAYAAHPEWLDDAFEQHALQPALRARIEDPTWRARTLADPKTEGLRAGLANNLRNLKTLYDAGVLIGFGSDSGGSPYRVAGVAEHRELALMVEAGLTPLQALTIATRNGAALLGLNDRGVLTAGKRADFVVLYADPSRDIANTRRIAAVWHRGREISLLVTVRP